MASQDIIKTLTIRAKTEGVQESTAALKGLASAHDGVAKSAASGAVVNDTASKSQLSLADSVAKAERRFNSALRAQQDFEKIQRQMNLAVAQNPALQERANAVIAQAATHYGQAGTAAKAFAAATSGVSGQLIALSAGAGPVGVFLSALGPWGIAAAVGIGALTAAFNHMIAEAARIGDKAIEMRQFADVTGLTIAQIKGLTQEGAKLGIGSEQITGAIEKFSVGLNEARKGAGDLFDKVREINPELALQLAQSRSTAEGWNIYSKALRAATDESQRNALARAGLGRGNIDVALLGVSTANAGGIDAMSKKISDVTGLTEEWVREVARLRAENVQLEKQIANTMASAYTKEVLERQNQFLKVQRDIVQATVDVQNARARAGQEPGDEFSMQRDNAIIRSEVTGRPAANDNAAIAEQITGKKGLTKATMEAADAAGIFAAAQAKEREEAVRVANLTKEQVGLLGSAATIDEQRSAKLKELNAAYLQHKFSLVSVTENQQLYNRAVTATNIDARVQKDALRLSQLGELATVVELNKQKEDALAKSIREGAKFSDSELAAIRERNKLLNENSKIENQMVFDRQQLFKSQTDQNIDAILRANGIPPASARAEAIRDYMRMTDAIRQMGDAGGQALSTFVKTFAETRDIAKATEAAAKGLLTTIIDVSAKRIVNAGLNAAFGDTAGMAAGATTAAGILTSAGATLAASIIAGATEAAAILGVGGVTAGTEVAAGGATAGTTMAVGGTVAATELEVAAPIIGLAINGPIIAAVAAIAAAAALLFSFGSGGDDGLSKQIKAWQDAMRRSFDFDQRRLQAQDDGSLGSKLQLFDRDAAKQRFEELEKGGFALAQLEGALSAERVKIIEDFGKQAAEAARQAEEEINKRRLAAQDRLFNATNDPNTLQGQLAAFDRQAQKDILAEREAGGQALIDLEGAQAAERLNIINDFNDKAIAESKRAAQEQLDAQTRAAKGIVDYLNNLKVGPDSSLSPTARLAAAQSTYNSVLALAQGGNVDALSRITQDAENLRKAAKDVYGSASPYQNILNTIFANLQGLPAVATSSDPVVQAVLGTTAAVEATRQAVLTDTASTVAKLDVSIARLMDTVTLLGSTVGRLDTTNTFLTSMNTFTNRVVNAINNLGSGPIVAIGNNMSNQLAAIRSDTFQMATHQAGSGAANGIYAGGLVGNQTFTFTPAELGATIPPHGFGIYGEHHPQGPFLMRAGDSPVPITPSMPSFRGSNDNDVLAELRALREEVKTLRAQLHDDVGNVDRSVRGADRSIRQNTAHREETVDREERSARLAARRAVA